VIALAIVFTVYVIVSGLYIRRLHSNIRVHEEAWKQIGTMTDHNKDGDVVLHVKHLDK
jgi:hypothetical protein